MNTKCEQLNIEGKLKKKKNEEKNVSRWDLNILVKKNTDAIK